VIWLSWRQFRVQAVAGAVVVAVAAVLLLATRHGLPVGPGGVYDQLTPFERNLYYAGIFVLAVAPALLGAFWGAPVVARELETGTHRLAWTQSVSRRRWLATKLGVAALSAGSAAALLTLLAGWWASALDGARSDTHGGLPTRLTPVAFAMRGIVPIGYAVFAVLLGAAIGVLLRRTIPAMAVTLALFAFVQIAVPLWVRPHLVPTATSTVTISRDTLDGFSKSGPADPIRITTHTTDTNDWIISNETVDAAGRAGTPAWLDSCLPGPPDPEVSGGPVKAPVSVKSTLDTCMARLTAAGYRQRVVYQPANHFWPLQWAELGLYLGLSAGLAAFCYYWTRRRLA
jgi:ABC-type transport system involved in multi-copper enzyme maturation permease subunit